MKHIKKPHHPEKKEEVTEDIFETCIRKGLIEKTPEGYIFKKEFFETLDIYDE